MALGVDTGTAIVFPGIGPALFADVAKFLLINPVARRMTADADEVLGYSLIDSYRDASGDYSLPARVAFLVSCLALAEWTRDTLGADAGICTGPSFGGTPAAVTSGALSLADAVQVTARWGRCTEEYFAQHHCEVVTQSFARTAEESLRLILAELDELGEWYDVSCYVDRDFYMLSLREGRLDWLRKRLRSLGGLPMYTMRPPMHSSAFRPLRDRIEREVLSDIAFADPVIPVICDHDGTVLESAPQIRTMLLDAVVRPVRWPAVATTLASRGVQRVYVAGQDALWGRVACMTERFKIVTVTPQTALQPRRHLVA
jgi:[acyl-carrier-protein] S-malonyltransferase